MGATVGRFANRIAHGKYVENSHAHNLAVNEHELDNCLHGGVDAFSSRLWDVCDFDHARQSLTFRLSSPDGDQGFPGNLDVAVTYALSGHQELSIEYRAETDRQTIVNLSNHAYFNLHGRQSDSIDDHQITINADNYTPINGRLIPSGEIASVIDTPFDFRRPVLLQDALNRHNEQLQIGNGIDHNFVLNCATDGEPAARVRSCISGIEMSIYTTKPGLQFYTGNMLSTPFAARSAFCLEPQFFPDSPNQSNFPSVALVPGEQYHHRTKFVFHHADV